MTTPRVGNITNNPVLLYSGGIHHRICVGPLPPRTPAKNQPGHRTHSTCSPVQFNL